jgi:hypothetical protein
MKLASFSPLFLTTDMTDYQQEISIKIATTLEKLQNLNPDLYAARYHQLYMINDVLKPQVWTVRTLHLIEQDLIENAK